MRKGRCGTDENGARRSASSRKIGAGQSKRYLTAELRSAPAGRGLAFRHQDHSASRGHHRTGPGGNARRHAVQQRAVPGEAITSTLRSLEP